ncbi:MAG TPA: DUF2917 domain-containing protein [Burkholderiales bacterium]|nr:DUF2917 domain-containing protein [Burkholderiales bacterium]
MRARHDGAMYNDGYQGIALGVECAWPAAEVRWLERGAILEMRDAAGTTVTTRDGVVWITEENSRRDVMLRPGQSYRLARSGLALVEAFTDASITFSAA